MLTPLEQFVSDLDELKQAAIDGRVDLTTACKLACAGKRLIRHESSDPVESSEAPDEPDDSPDSIESLGLSAKLTGLLKSSDNGPAFDTVTSIQAFIADGGSLAESKDGIGPKAEADILSKLNEQ